jgi:8-oxo-dGTP pyrophosphatase MutT (NUDIX family)
MPPRGGRQDIPRPWVWRPGRPPRWASALAAAGPLPSTAELATLVAARGPGAKPRTPLLGARQAAVLVALFDGPRGAEVILTRRAGHLRSHRGEISFPGGRTDPGETPAETAMREAREEILLDPGLVRRCGELDHIATPVSHAEVVPVVGTLAERPDIRPGTAEVDRILTVPLMDLLDSGVYHEERWGVWPLVMPIHFFTLEDETVWGATAHLLRELLEVALGVAPARGRT